MRQELLDNLRHGADVLTSDGELVGFLHAIVLNPGDNDVTHIVVNTGPLPPAPGFGSPKLVEVPIDQMDAAGEEVVRLRVDKPAFRRLPQYAERAYTPAGLSESTPPETKPAPAAEGGLHPLRTLWNVGAALAAALGSVGGIAVPRETFHKAQFERHILNDAPVWRQEPHQQIGEVERVLINDATDEIEALVIRRGHLFPHEMVLPMGYVAEILDGDVRVQISDEELKQLEPYRA